METNDTITADEITDILEKSPYSDYIRISEYNGKPFLLVEGSYSLKENFEKYLNGFTVDPRIEEPYLPQGKDISDLIAEAKALTVKEPNSYNHERLLKALTTHLLWLQHKALLETYISLNHISDLDYGFSDEYDTCIECQTVLRISPDCYDWTAPLFLDAEGYVCDDCAVEHYAEHVKEEFKNERKNIPHYFSMQYLGLEKVNDEDFQNGLYGGQADNPEKIVTLLNSHNIDCWFRVYPSQFEVLFDVYTIPEHVQAAKDLLSENSIEGVDPADMLKKGLQSADLQMESLPEGEGVRYSKIDLSTGTAESRIVGPEEFIKGIK